MENNNNKDVINLIDEEINLILTKVFISIEEKEKINQEKCDADIKFNTLNLDDIISQVNNSTNSFSSFDNIILSNSMNNFFNEEKENKKEPIKINNIEELLLNEEQITEIIYTYDKRYEECFNETNMLKLIDYSTHMAYISDDEISTHKYPFYACELLKCDAPYIFECFFNNERIISYFFEFLNDSKNNSNCVLSGYFTKIFLSLLDKKNDEIINYIFKEENLYIERIIELCNNSSFCECIKNILNIQSNKYDDKKLFIVQKLNQKIFRNEEYTNNICFEIYGSLFEEGNLIFCNFFLKNFENININFKHKSFNLELFFYYIHLVRIIKECFTREKENNIDIDSTRKELNTYVINNKKIFLDFEINLIDSLTNILFIQNSVEDNIENITYRRIIVSYLDILEYIIFTVSIKESDKNDKKEENKNETGKNDTKFYINKIHEIFTNNILFKITNVIFRFPLFNMLQISYINLFSTLSKIKSPLLNNDLIINKFIDYLIKECPEQDILLSFLIKILSIIFQSLQEQNILINKKLRHMYDCLIKNIMDIFESKLLFNKAYEQDKINNNSKNINADEIENINFKNDKILYNKDNNISNDENENETNKNGNNNIDNNSNINSSFKDMVNKGIYEYISFIKFCSSSKNVNSAEIISEEIDLDDMNDDDFEKIDNIGNNKNYALSTFDELDKEKNKNNNNSEYDNMEEMYKKATETIKTIRLKNKINHKDKNKNLDLNKDINNNIDLNKDKKNNLDLEIKNGNKDNNNSSTDSNEDIIEENINVEKKNENNNGQNDEDKIFNSEKKDNYIRIEEKKINEILNKSNEKLKHNFFFDKENQNSLPLIKMEKDKINKMKKNKSELNDNPEISSKVNVKSIFEYNNKTINVLPKIRIKLDDQEHGRYFYRDMNIINRTSNNNFNEKINNFRSNNIIKTKENKETSLFNTLRKSSENGSNYKYNLTILNHTKQNDNK